MPLDDTTYRHSDPVVARLVRARARIAEGGWLQRCLRHDGAYCARGAIMCPDGSGAIFDVAARDEVVTAEAALVAAIGGPTPADRVEAVERLTTAATIRLVNWNNAPERTRADVLAAFDRAIALRVAELAGAVVE